MRVPAALSQAHPHAASRDAERACCAADGRANPHTETTLRGCYLHSLPSFGPLAAGCLGRTNKTNQPPGTTGVWKDVSPSREVTDHTPPGVATC